MTLNIHFGEIAAVNFILAIVLWVLYLLGKDSAGPCRLEGLFWLSAVGMAIVGLFAVAFQLWIPSFSWALALLAAGSVASLLPLLPLAPVAGAVIVAYPVLYGIVHLVGQHVTFH